MPLATHHADKARSKPPSLMSVDTVATAPGNRHRMVPVPKELETVRQIIDLWRTGVSHRAIAAKLNMDGVPTKHGARWHHTTVGKVVQRQDWYLERLSAS